MWSLVSGRIIQALFTIWFTMTLVFFLLRVVPGNVIEAQLHGTGLPSEVIELRKASLGLDQSIVVQYANFVERTVRGDLGNSLYTSQPVLEILRQRYPPTIQLILPSIILMICFGIGIGLLACSTSKPIRWFSHFWIDFSLGMPIYWTATLVLFIFSIDFGNQIILPILVLGFHSSGSVARVVYRQIQEMRHASHVMSARGRGLPPRILASRYLLLPTLPPILSVIGIQMGILFGGTVLIESIFSHSGVGILLLTAAIEQNYPVVQGIILVVVTIYIMINLCVDICNIWIDPRFRTL